MSYSKSQIEKLWVQYGGDPKAAGTAAAIALAESSGNPEAENHNSNGSIDRGLFQVNSIHGSLSTKDVASNVRAAIRISGNGKNWEPWVTYQTGAYKKYIRDGTSIGNSTSPSSGASRTLTRTIPGQSFAQERAVAASDFLSSGRNDSQNNLDFALQIRGLQDVPNRTVTSSVAPSPSAPPSGGLAEVARQRANAIDAQHLPYSWGGGHAGRTPLTDAVPLDCSGAVSKVLGIDPRVSGQFQSWGRPGDGGSKGVTVASNSHHVLMKIDGHWWGTSRSNPGGGAGWIPQSQITPAYLKGFTLRHSAR